jgi:hypothetical protein
MSWEFTGGLLHRPACLQLIPCHASPAPPSDCDHDSNSTPLDALLQVYISGPSCCSHGGRVA